jgi:hypothetical protein
VTEYRPRPDVVYRCPVCHLKLMFDDSANRLTVAPFREGEAAVPVDLLVERRRRSR